MPAAVVLQPAHVDAVAEYLAAMRTARRKTGRSTVQAARTFCAKLERAGGWEQLSRLQQVDAIGKARSFASWLLVTGQLSVSAEVFGRVDLWLGSAARSFCPAGHAWFVQSGERLGTPPGDVALQWNTLVKVTAMTGTAPDQITEREFERARTALVDAYVARGLRASGRNITSVFHRLRLTLFHAGRLETYRHPSRHAPVSITGWAAVTTAYATRRVATWAR
jgi:integrase/recombinase XerD